MTKSPVAVVTASGEPNLDVASRVCYGIYHPVQYNVKVKDIGYVPWTQIAALIEDWKEEEDGGTEVEYDVTATAEEADDDNGEEQQHDEGNEAQFTDTDGEEDELYMVA
jgi:hypothetical protein